MIDPGHCYGCRTYFYAWDYCRYSIHNNESEGLCPCVECIVKSMCDVDCPAFSEWTETDGSKKALHKSLYSNRRKRMKDYLIDQDIKLIDAKVAGLKSKDSNDSKLAIAELLKAKAALITASLGVESIIMAEKLYAEASDDLGDPDFTETAAGGAGDKDN